VDCDLLCKKSIFIFPCCLPVATNIGYFPPQREVGTGSTVARLFQTILTKWPDHSKKFVYLAKAV
jgi:hypothetical protein